MKTVKSKKQFKNRLGKGYVEEAPFSSEVAVYADYFNLESIEKLPGIWIKEVSTTLALSVDYGIFEDVFPEHCYLSTTIALCVTQGACDVDYDYGDTAFMLVGSTLVIPPGVYFRITPRPRVEMFIACTPAWDRADVVSFP